MALLSFVNGGERGSPLFVSWGERGSPLLVARAMDGPPCIFFCSMRGTGGAHLGFRKPLLALGNGQAAKADALDGVKQRGLVHHRLDRPHSTVGLERGEGGEGRGERGEDQTRDEGRGERGREKASKPGNPQTTRSSASDSPDLLHVCR